MSQILRWVGIALLAGLAGAQPKPSVTSIGGLAFMSGCWAFQSGERVTEEFWTKPAGGTMLGIGRAVNAGKTTFTEYGQIREENGVLTMFVQLRLAGSTTAFRLTKLEGDEAVFTSDLEYPKRLVYRRMKDGSLFARTEGMENGKEKSEPFPYRRVTCP
jgi:hypothetical protein